jgi:hypothetical protein
MERATGLEPARSMLVPLEHGPRLMPTDLHPDSLRDTRPDHVPDRCPPEIVRAEEPTNSLTIWAARIVTQMPLASRLSRLSVAVR